MLRLPPFPRPVMASLAAIAVVMTPAMAQNEDQPDIEAGTESGTEAGDMTKGEKQLAKLLEGRVAGEPVRCIRNLPNQRMQTIDNTAYVFGSGYVIYVQRTRSPEDIDSSDTLVTQRFQAGQLCRLDVITTIDRLLGFFTGAVFFEDFVPYTRVKEEPSAKS
ncbi:MAG: hypothetical protein NXH71_09405 [Erythrobacteraceae bacterium]|jgi:hypothetical protein|nr:hypothetical protein [Erythrobacteraceae bacterium]